jgi:hypothetical protein
LTETDVVRLAPIQEETDGMVVRLPRVGIADVGGEEFQEPAGRPIAGLDDYRRNEVGNYQFPMRTDGNLAIHAPPWSETRLRLISTFVYHMIRGERNRGGF